MKKYIEKLHFITHDLPSLSHVEQAQQACEAGAKWIQYRCLTKTDAELLKEIEVIAGICDDWGSTLIVTNHIHLFQKADIQGFHIEDMEADFPSIRARLDQSVTLGGSSNTLEGLIRMADGGLDYAGFGPFRTTLTKPNDLPLLGTEGYTQAMLALKNLGIDLPVLAVGGVRTEDIDELMDTGIWGIAASSGINQSPDLRLAYRSFYDKIM